MNPMNGGYWRTLARSLLQVEQPYQSFAFLFSGRELTRLRRKLDEARKLMEHMQSWEDNRLHGVRTKC